MGEPKDWLLPEFDKHASKAEPSAGRTMDVPGTHATERQTPPPGGPDLSVGRESESAQLDSTNPVITDLAAPPSIERQPEPKPSQAPPQTFTEGDRVTWTARNGKQLSERIRSLDENHADIDTDQVARIGGRVPIGRIERVPTDRLTNLNETATKPADLQAPASIEEPEKPATMGSRAEPAQPSGGATADRSGCVIREPSLWRKNKTSR